MMTIMIPIRRLLLQLQQTTTTTTVTIRAVILIVFHMCDCVQPQKLAKLDKTYLVCRHLLLKLLQVILFCTQTGWQRTWVIARQVCFQNLNFLILLFQLQMKVPCLLDGRTLTDLTHPSMVSTSYWKHDECNGEPLIKAHLSLHLKYLCLHLGQRISQLFNNFLHLHLCWAMQYTVLDLS